MKKLLALLLCLMMVVPTFALAEDVEIAVWVYPVGGWTAANVDPLVAEFEAAHPGIKVTVQYLDYQNGDATVTAAIESGTTPDVIMEGPERLVTNWGANGKILPLNDLWTPEATADIIAASAAVEAACKNSEGTYYEYPLCMTTHCMVINRNYFEKAGALQYVDETTHTWTTEGFLKACEALVDAGYVPGMVYCGGQGGDQGTRALVNNLYSGKFTNAEHTAYTADSAENLKALETLQSLVNDGLLDAGPAYVAGDEIPMFCNGTLAMGFCWNAAAADSNKANLAEDVEAFPMAFPSDDGIPELCGGIWGFGIFDNKDEARAEAAKTFIRWAVDDPVQGPKSVYISGFFPTKASITAESVYGGTEKESYMDYSIFMPYLGDYYNVIGGWAQQRTEWWNLLQRVLAGGNVADEVAVYVTNANGSIK